MGIYALPAISYFILIGRQPNSEGKRSGNELARLVGKHQLGSEGKRSGNELPAPKYVFDISNYKRYNPLLVNRIEME